MEKLEKIVEQLSELTVIQAAELSKLLEEKWGVSAAAPVAAAASGPVASEAVAEKTEFQVDLVNIGDKKLEVIRTVRDITGLDLKAAKDFVDAAPKTIKQGIKKEEAESIKSKLESAGAKVEIK